jgi:uncharacterized protein YbbC (DUF1343 family)
MTDPGRYDPVRTALVLLSALQAEHPGQFRFSDRQFDRLAGGPGLRQAIVEGRHPGEILGHWQAGLERFRRRVRPFLLYP